MKNGTPSQSKQTPARSREDALKDLLSHASSRPEPSDEIRSRARVAVQKEWQAVTAKRRWRRMAVGLAAAVVLVVTLVVFEETRTPAGPELREMARVERVSGHVRVLAEQSSENGAALAIQMPVYVGQSLRSGVDSGISLRLGAGMSLRVDQNSNLRLVDEHTVELESGRLYVDTESHRWGSVDAMPAKPRIVVITARGIVRHLGTQFMVRVAKDELRVSVREGRVQFRSESEAGSAPLYVAQGEALSVSEEGEPALSPSETSGEQWQWAEELGPGLDLDGRTMAEFLEWVERETGNEIVYRSDQARSAAVETELHGTVDLPARRALDLMLMSSDLSAEFRDGVIEISIKP